MKGLLTLFCSFVLLVTNAQIGNTLFGLARKSSPSYEVYMAQLDPNTGIVTNLDTTLVGTIINITGAALNPYTNTYHFVGIDEFKTVDLSTGILTNNAPITNPIADSYFDNFRFNNSDTTIYGLARRYIQATSTGEIYLATINAQTGVITQISPTSVGEGYSLEGSAIDPYQKVFYYSDGSNLVGLDMYNGAIYSNPPITIAAGGNTFGHFAYSCVDTTLYGLIRSTSGPFLLDLYLGKIDPSTGIVSVISPAPLAASTAYSVNAGATIDPSTMTYYYSTGDYLMGVSLLTGVVVSQQAYIHDNGCQYFDLMRIESNCYNARTALRPNPAASISEPDTQLAIVQIIPNPASTSIQLQSDIAIQWIELYDATGQMVAKLDYQADEAIQISNLDAGVYFVKAMLENQRSTTIRFVKE